MRRPRRAVEDNGMAMSSTAQVDVGVARGLAVLDRDVAAAPVAAQVVPGIV
ncbi:hypothetical protein SK803_02890 [Lentzea sp. BCCO 10_0856]|uniref:Uncharacterized protein n=1 Tax=Lentzea miocenica TaxID=3095431 RepID=A0ABU4STD2_9PSEU|nr:hypothetical protein [Lentzea sp. BCCO 10_0856]MDX8029136.1 hypothetical protein [Lentzea sp. BCCO 10_0856]